MENIKIISIYIMATLFIFLIAMNIYYNENVNNNKITGYDAINTRVNLLPIQPSNCSFHLNVGWNMVSFFCFGMWEPRDDTLDTINSSYDVIFAYDSSDSADPWKSYKKDLPAWAVQQLNHLDRVSGYMIYMNSEADYEFNGSKKSTPIPLRRGWNLVGYPRIVNDSINNSLNSIAYSTVKYYDNNADAYLSYISGASNNTLSDFDIYHGYWINSSTDQYWNLNAT